MHACNSICLEGKEGFHVTNIKHPSRDAYVLSVLKITGGMTVSKNYGHVTS